MIKFVHPSLMYKYFPIPILIQKLEVFLGRGEGAILFCKICTNECKKNLTFLYTCILIQLAVSTASGNEESVTTPVYLAILKGLERLLLTDVLSQQDSDAIVKLGVDR